MTALIAVAYANFFAGLSIVSVMMFDSQGASIQEGLPQSTRMTLNAKAGIAIPIFIVSLVLISIILALQPLFTPLLLLIPLAQIPAGYAIAVLVGGVVYKIQGGGRAVAITFTGNTATVFVAGIVAGIIGLLPLIGYGITMLLTGMHVLCLTVQLVAGIISALLVNRFVSRLLKD